MNCKCENLHPIKGKDRYYIYNNIKIPIPDCALVITCKECNQIWLDSEEIEKYIKPYLLSFVF